jgi:hypothetical protein
MKVTLKALLIFSITLFTGIFATASMASANYESPPGISFSSGIGEATQSTVYRIEPMQVSMFERILVDPVSLDAFAAMTPALNPKKGSYKALAIVRMDLHAKPNKGFQYRQWYSDH